VTMHTHVDDTAHAHARYRCAVLRAQDEEDAGGSVDDTDSGMSAGGISGGGMSAGASAWGGGNTQKSVCDKLQVVSQEILDTIC